MLHSEINFVVVVVVVENNGTLCFCLLYNSSLNTASRPIKVILKVNNGTSSFATYVFLTVDTSTNSCISKTAKTASKSQGQYILSFF